MPSQYSIELVSSKNIDKTKWNACLQRAQNRLLYAGYDYLQGLTDNWLAIVVNDYEAIMPVPFRKKWGIKYCYDAPFVQQLGLFGNDAEELLKEVINTITKHIRYGDLFLNFGNKMSNHFLNVRMAENYVLPLSADYKTIYNRYSQHLKTCLKKSSKNKLVFQTNSDVNKAVLLFQSLYSARLPQIQKRDYERLQNLAQQFILSNQCFVAFVFDQKNNLLATALFFKDDNRIYNILPSTTAEGRKLNAMHFLLDNVIQQYAGSRTMLDFEGSNVPGIKAFYQSFGAVNQPYFHYHFNHLPFPLGLLKR